MSFLAMLALISMVISCSQETAMGETEKLEAHSAKSSKGSVATRAIRAKLNNDANPDLPPNMDCGFSLSANFIYGNMGHLGKIQPGSYGQPTSCVFFDPSNDRYPGQFYLETTYNVNYIGANGDAIHTTENTIIIFDDETFETGRFEGTVTVDPDNSTGRFEGATGNMVFVDARFAGSISTWRLEGEITY